MATAAGPADPDDDEVSVHRDGADSREPRTMRSARLQVAHDLEGLADEDVVRPVTPMTWTLYSRQLPRGAYMITVTPSRQTNAPVRS
jgi:hypothetical protein